MPEAVRNLAVRTVPIGDIKPNPRNPRTHTRRQIQQIAKSLAAFGWTNPILVDYENNVIAGHGRLQAAKLASYTEVPIIAIGDMTAAQTQSHSQTICRPISRLAIPPKQHISLSSPPPP